MSFRQGFLLIILSTILFRKGLCDDFTCSDATTIFAFSTQCSLVTWSVARLVDHNRTIESDYYPEVYDIEEQEERVSVMLLLYNNM